MQVYSVIGANYGDEGKGMVSAHIRHFAGASGTITILTNGGAQRGHTVCDKNGMRTVFHHLGSSMRGDRNITYCPDTFVVNPLVLCQDIHQLLARDDVPPAVFLDPGCLVTTPYDMMANQIEEILAGADRQGSTGMGVWHTMHRSKYVPMRTADLNGLAHMCPVSKLKQMLNDVKRYWLDSYFSYRIKDIPDEYMALFANERLAEHWIDDLAYSLPPDAVTVANPFAMKHDYESVIFENAQGLLLDKCRGEHTTPSSTGIRPVVDLVRSLGLGAPSDMCAYYVSRTYLTRHGAGPFPGECPKELLNVGMTDPTNVPNPWQGSLRYGVLDAKPLVERIQADLLRAGLRPDNCRKVKLVMTHVNEVPNRDKCLGSWLDVVEVDNPYMADDCGLFTWKN